jgi:serine/threonine protein kinase
MGICCGRPKFAKEPTFISAIDKSLISKKTILENINQDYEFIRVLGHGHFGVVREAKKRKMLSDVTFAIKSVNKDRL